MSSLNKLNDFYQQLWYVYLLKCSNGNLYTGCTNNLEGRYKSHNSGQVDATKKILPVEIIAYIGKNA